MPLPSWWPARLRRSHLLWWPHRRDLAAADRVADGTRPADPALHHVLDALRAPATPAEHAAEQQMIAALAAERRRAPAREHPGSRRKASRRTIVVAVAAALALLTGSGTAVAARGGNLPAGVQQQAHRLFSGLGVPAPASPPSGPEPGSAEPDSPRPDRTPTPGDAGGPPQAGPDATTDGSAGTATAPGAAMSAGTSTQPESSAATTTGKADPSASVNATTKAAWCAAWQTAEDGGHPMNGRDRRDLIAAAGGRENVAAYCGSATTEPEETSKTKKPKD
ncbi:hypothetical protein ACTI_60320 [Actinoplanes sp. OR16]|uniref:hypothetical protein n=1 Tax=Actinoplanes sp. OR16 TaxID=946334 RepID=UPI000F6B3C6F|nr:hypothetical protein [Actinoplanes sp. OR16]BBH69347.1 hypothetical protein ACTI_60320 [Actinoplanes sp. OR16]